MKQQINVFDYAGHICESMKKGILITAKVGDKVNPMTIGWGTLGIQWGRPIFIAYVREHRYTYDMLEKNPEFTINVPIGEVDKVIDDKNKSMKFVVVKPYVNFKNIDDVIVIEPRNIG